MFRLIYTVFLIDFLAINSLEFEKTSILSLDPNTVDVQWKNFQRKHGKSYDITQMTFR